MPVLKSAQRRVQPGRNQGDTVSKHDRAKRHERRNNPPNITIQIPRDLDVLEAVYLHRVLSQYQLQRLFFPSKDRTQQRLRLLYDHAYLDRRFQPQRVGETGRTPNLYVLDRKGSDLLKAERPELEVVWHHSYKDPSDEYLRHLLPLNEFMVVVTLAAKSRGYKVHEWQTEAQLKAAPQRVRVQTATGRKRDIAVVPDTFFSIQQGRYIYPFMVEQDGTTQTAKVIKQKIRMYHAYYTSGKYTERYGYNSFRVLFVTGSGKRLQSLKRWTEELNLDGQHHFYFAVHSQLSPKTLFDRPVWYRAGSQEPLELLTTST